MPNCGGRQRECEGTLPSKLRRSIPDWENLLLARLGPLRELSVSS